MPKSKAFKYLTRELRKRGLRLKTLEELFASGLLRTPPTKGLYDIPSKQYEPPPANEDCHPLSGYALWYDRMRRDRTWAIGFMKHLVDSMDWQFAGVSEGKRKVGKVENVPTLTARYVYQSLDIKLGVTWLVTSANDADDLIGLRFTKAGESEARWVKPADVVLTIKDYIINEYSQHHPDHPRRSWAR